MGILRKAKHRVETLIAWIIAITVVTLVVAGAYYVVTVV